MDLGPKNGTMRVLTGVEGAAARLGHRLTIEVADWSAHVDVADGAPVAVSLRADLNSLRVIAGQGGATPLTPVDKQLIRRNATKTLDTRHHPEVRFDSASVSLEGSRLQVVGELTIHGVTRALTAALEVTDDRVEGAIPVTQSDFGIKPYSQMLGQLRVRDEVQVVLDVTVSL
jgi:polyisoprenoid-binding protein YceI